MKQKRYIAALDHLEYWTSENIRKKRLKWPLSFQYMEELTNEFKIMKDDQFLKRFEKVCKDLDAMTSFVDASLPDIVLQPEETTHRHYAK